MGGIVAGGWSSEPDGLGGFKAKVDVPGERSINYYCVKTAGTKTFGVSTIDIDNFGWENSNCYGTIQAAIAQMVTDQAGGSQCWVDDGTYTRNQTVISFGAALSGTPAAFTVIRARNPGNVELATTAASGGSGIKLSGASYVRLEGFHIANVSAAGDRAAVYLTGCHHILVKRCSWGSYSGLATGNSHYITWEDCFAFGGPLRYPFQNGTSGDTDTTSHIIYRRCLVRFDYSNTTYPTACFATYTSEHIAYQNCISIDGTDYKAIDKVSEDGLKSYFTPNGSTDVTYNGCISARMTGSCGWWLEGPIVTATVTNCIGWDHASDYPSAAGDLSDTYGPKCFASTADYGDGVTLRNCTFGVNDIAWREDRLTNPWPASSEPMSFEGSIPESMRNCIIYGMELYDGTVYAVTNGLADCDYNCFYGNTGGRNRQAGVGAHSKTTVNPVTQPTLLTSAGEGGVRIGALITHKVGLDGTFWGDPGWDQPTGYPLWPWPYEDQIRARCAAFYKAPLEAYSIAGGASFDSPEMIGERGFCSGAYTLTSYLFDKIPIGLRVAEKGTRIKDPDFSDGT